MRVLKDRYKGRKCIIICNGPSLNKVDFRLLERSSFFTFGLNKINLIFPRTDLRPSVVVAVNPYVIEQNAVFFNQTKIPLFLDSNGKRSISFRQNVVFLHAAGYKTQFALDCSMSINQGYTVTYVAMQLAFHMGFTDVALVGCDHAFSTKGQPNMAVTSGKEDLDHFDPNYFAGGAKWQLPDLLGSELHYQAAKETYERFGRRIYNCTQGGRLEIFERKPLSDFLKG